MRAFDWAQADASALASSSASSVRWPQSACPLCSSRATIPARNESPEPIGLSTSLAVSEALPTASALVIAGSQAPGYPPGYQAQLAGLAHQAGVPVAVDLQGPALAGVLAMRPALVKINLAEFVATFLADRFHGGEHSGMLAQPALAAELVAAIAQVSRAHAATSFVLTRGANSIVLARDGQTRVVAVTPLAASEVLSPIGSGDSFLAGMVARLLQADTRNWDRLSLDELEDATALATACAQSNARTARPGVLDHAFARH